MNLIGETNPTLSLLQKSIGADVDSYTLQPIRKRITFTRNNINKDGLIIEYINKSNKALTGANHLFGTKPLVLGTTDPINHFSTIATSKWPSPNRPTIEILRRSGSDWTIADYISPGEVFAYKIPIDNTKIIKKQQERSNSPPLQHKW